MRKEQSVIDEYVNADSTKRLDLFLSNREYRPVYDGLNSISRNRKRGADR